MSNAILEAMAMQKPVVATDVGGTNEVVQAGRTGLLVPPADAVALAAAIAGLLADPARRAAFGANGRARVQERFDVEASVDRYGALFRELAAGRR
jgi:glycosyltransferase involved in cell wall biosynthesis